MSNKPHKIVHTSREVIENKLLTALGDENIVAALFSKEDLDALISALWNHEGDIKKRARQEELREGLIQLRADAFRK